MCTPSPLHSPAFASFCVFALLCIIPDENIICLLSVRLSHTNPNPQKWQLSYTGIMSPPPPFNQKRLITGDLDWHSFVTAHLKDGLMEGSNWRMTERKKKSKKKRRKKEITLSSGRWWQQNIVEERASRHLLSPWLQALVVCFQFPSLSSPHIPILFLFFKMQHIR